MTTVVAEPETDQETALSPLYRIIIHNDDTTTMDFVVSILISEFGREEPEAVRIMWEAHGSGAAHVMTCGLEEATLRTDRARSLARARSFPLAFSIEPES